MPTQYSRAGEDIWPHSSGLSRRYSEERYVSTVARSGPASNQTRLDQRHLYLSAQLDCGFARCPTPVISVTKKLLSRAELPFIHKPSTDALAGDRAIAREASLILDDHLFEIGASPRPCSRE